MKPKVFIARKISREILDYISEFVDYKMNESDEILPRDEIMKKYGYIDGFMTAGTKIDKEFLDSMPNLKIVSNMTVGYDNLKIEDMKDRGVLGTNTPDTLNDTVADLTFALILSAARRIPEMDKITKGGLWE